MSKVIAKTTASTWKIDWQLSVCCFFFSPIPVRPFYLSLTISGITENGMNAPDLEIKFMPLYCAVLSRARRCDCTSLIQLKWRINKIAQSSEISRKHVHERNEKNPCQVADRQKWSAALAELPVISGCSNALHNCSPCVCVRSMNSERCNFRI